MIVEVTVGWGVGAYSFHFRKRFDLPAPPFYDMWLDDEDLNIQLCNNQYTRTYIGWDVIKNIYTVRIQEHSREPLAPEFVDECVRLYTGAGWENVYGDPEKFKENMAELSKSYK